MTAGNAEPFVSGTTLSYHRLPNGSEHPELETSRQLMSWYTKVAWTEGLFLRPHHFQQNDRYHEHLLESRVRFATPYPWGFSYLEIDRDLAQQSKFSLRRGGGGPARRPPPPPPSAS